MEPQKSEHVGGSIDGALQGQHLIENRALLKESWHKCKGFRLVFFKGFLMVLLVSLLLMFMLQGLVAYQGYSLNEPNTLIGLQFILNILISPLLLSLEVMGLYRVLGGNLSFAGAFVFVRPKITLVIFVNLVIGLAATGLSQLSILLGFLLSLLALFVPMLVVEKKLPVGRAFQVSMVSLFRQLFSILLLFIPLVLIAAVALSVLLLMAQAFPVLTPVVAFLGGVILINLLAWLYLLKGALYRDLFGIRVASGNSDSSVMGSFSA